MKREYGKLKAEIAKVVYRSMYKSNYKPTSGEINVVSRSANTANKRALTIAVREKNSEIGANKFCVVTFESPVSNKDSQLNMKALDLANKQSKPLTKP